MNPTVVVLVEDLFWRTKIDHAVKSAQGTSVFLSDPAELSKALETSATGVVLIDLALKKDPFAAITALKKKTKTRKIPIIGFFEHVRVDLKEKAMQAGCDEVLPRSSFSQRLADLVLKYALPGSVRTDSNESELPEE